MAYVYDMSKVGCDMSNVVYRLLAVVMLILSIGAVIVVIGAPPDMIIVLTTLIVVVPAVLIVMAIGLLVISLIFRRLWRLGQTNSMTLSADIVKFRRSHLLEIGFIVLVALFVSRHHLNFDPNIRVQGVETEWLTGYGEVAYQGLQTNGTIPLWNPHYQQGEPLIDSPFSYLLNPFSSIPQLLLGGTNGTKISIVIQTSLVGIGGWFLARVMGLSIVGRLVLAILLIGKGNMHTNFDAGFFQLASQQVYFPWVIAGVLAVIKTNSRWSIMLTAVSFSLMFLAGNLWHLLPMVISAGVLIIAYAIFLRIVTIKVMRSLLMIALIIMGLCATTLPSIVAGFNLIESHNDQARAGWEILEPNRAYLLPFVGDSDFATYDLYVAIPVSDNRMEDTITTLSWKQGGHFYYSYVALYWYVLVILLPLLLFSRHRHRIPDNRVIWIGGVGLFFVFTMWGMGGTPLFRWLYDNVPYLAQWRFVQRAFAMASFWVAVLVALRIDTLMRLVWYQRRRYWRGISVILLVGYGVLTGLAGVDVNSKWADNPLMPINREFDECLLWLQQAEPDDYHMLWIAGYEDMTSLIQRDMRMINIEADYLLTAPPNTIGDPRLDFRNRLTARRTMTFLNTKPVFEELGYYPREDSPSYNHLEHCIYENEDYALPYAFVVDVPDWMTIDNTESNHDKLTQDILNRITVQPMNEVMRNYDQVAVYVRGDLSTERALVIQELAYPGWEVWIDGVEHSAQVFGKLNAVLLPQDGQFHEVVFLYRPPLVEIGGVITIVTVLLSIGFLLRLDTKVLQTDVS